MNVAIVGAGNIGGGLARAWAKHGHALRLVVRDAKDADVQQLVAETKAQLVPLRDAIAFAEVVVLAVPYAALDAVIAEAGSLAGKVVVDCTNAVGPGGLRFGHTTSSAEELAKQLPGAHVVRSFNAQGAENLANPVYDGVRATNFYCGDDAGAKAKVRQLIEDVGFEPVDAGGLDKSRLLEPLMLLWISCARQLGTRDLAFKILRR
jgi:predicted dinucleotide-binding enzyme